MGGSSDPNPSEPTRLTVGMRSPFFLFLSLHFPFDPFPIRVKYNLKDEPRLPGSQVVRRMSKLDSGVKTAAKSLLSIDVDVSHIEVTQHRC